MNTPFKPRIEVCVDDEATALQVAQHISAAIQANPKIVLGLATGGTPVGVYRELVRMHRQDGLDFSGVTTFNLDEYIGLGPDHPRSYRYFMRQQLFDHVNIHAANTFVPDGLAADIALHAKAYEQRIAAAGGIDLQLLGIGGNGHIAFNEPGSTAVCRTRQIELTAATITANSRFFASEDEVPRTAITMGIGTILEAKQIVLMATGLGKADAVQQAIEGRVDEQNPASFLQHHANVIYLLDRPAASKLHQAI
jgi:glucosamine-6-phosphate deaminase